MSRKEKLVFKLLAGKADANFSIDELILILSWYEFEERKGKGSHRIFTRRGIAEMINLQATKDGQAKPYQVKQVREFLITHKLLNYE